MDVSLKAQNVIYGSYTRVTFVIENSHLREHVFQRVSNTVPVFKTDDFHPEIHELAVQEAVYDPHLEHDVQEVDELHGN